MPFIDKQKFEKLVGSGREKANPVKEVKKEAPKDLSGFGGKPYLTHQELSRWGKKPELFTKTGGVSEKDRLGMLEESFSPKYGPLLEKAKRKGEKGEPEKILKELQEKKFQAKTGAEQLMIDKKIKLWNKFLGK